MTIQKLYWPESTLPTLTHKGIIYKDVPVLWIAVRSVPILPYNQLIAHYDELELNDQSDGEGFADELLTREELDQLYAYVYEKFHTTISAEEYIVPINTMGRGSAKDVELVRDVGLYKLSQEADYNLPFKVWAHYTVIDLDTAQVEYDLNPVLRDVPDINIIPVTQREKWGFSVGNEVEFIIEHDFINVGKHDFFGSCCISPDRQYVLAWRDGDDSDYRGGARNSGKGTYLLIKKTTIKVVGKLERPNDGRVANNGTFVVQDWMFEPGSQGTFYAFDNSGKQLIKHYFNANLHQSAISKDGKYAICTTAGSDGSDSTTISLFDLQRCCLVWQQSDRFGLLLASDFEFDVDQRIIYLVFDNMDKFPWGFDGKPLDEKAWFHFLLQRGFILSHVINTFASYGEIGWERGA